MIILPTVALRQWQTEITRFTKAGSLTMYCYHGNMRSSDDILQTLCDVDVVLTSYKIVEIEYRRATAGSKIECSICGKKFYPEKLRVHRKYFCGETAQRTSAQSKTERKSSKGRAITDDSSSDSDSEDEVDRQKKAIKKKLDEDAKGANKKKQTPRRKAETSSTKSKVDGVKSTKKAKQKPELKKKTSGKKGKADSDDEDDESDSRSMLLLCLQ